MECPYHNGRCVWRDNKKDIGNMGFREDFLWGVATSAYQIEEHKTSLTKDCQYGMFT